MSEFDGVATPDDVFKLAANRTGLAEIDSDSWRDGLAIMLDDLNSSPAFTPFGRERVLDDATNALGRRMQVHAYIEAHPEVLDAPVERPLFVLGMPRAGTTVISYLLDQDPARRSLLHWQCVDPIPPASTETLRTDPRCLALLEEQRKIVEIVKQAKIPLPHWKTPTARPRHVHPRPGFQGPVLGLFPVDVALRRMAVSRNRHDEHLRYQNAICRSCSRPRRDLELKCRRTRYTSKRC